MLRLNDIDVTFMRDTEDKNELFKKFNFSVNDGDFISVVGSNGSGKTTMLNLICGSLIPDGGQVIFNGRDITRMKEYKRAEFIGRVFQDPKSGTCSELTVLENFALADNKNKIFGLTAGVSRKRIEYYRELLCQCNMGLENRMNSLVGSLSGGQRQAIALVIAGMTKVDLLILDEHTAALDPKSSERIMELTEQLVKKNNITTLMVTHNLRFAVEYGNRIVMMHRGNIVINASGEEKARLTVNDLLGTFNNISVECGN